MAELRLDTPFGEITVIDEPTYSLGSADNVRAYPRELIAGKKGWSFYGLALNGEAMLVVTGDGGPTEVHKHSAVLWGDQLIVAVGNQCVCLTLPALHERWSKKVDMATCFGVHTSLSGEALVVHGELGISRLSPEGIVLWERGGRDIFTGEFEMGPDMIEAEDFNGDRYKFDYDGRLVEGPTP